jgi:hypothetical protein
MVVIVSLFLVSYILGMFYDDTIAVVISAASIAMITVMIGYYELFLMSVSGTGTYTDLVGLVSAVQKNVGVVLAYWVMFYPVKYILRSFLPGRGDR